MAGPLNDIALTQLRTSVREAVMRSDLSTALQLLLEALPPERPKSRQVILLQARYTALLDDQINNTQTEQDLTVTRNNLTHDVLLFADHLSLTDFVASPANRPDLKPGHLLYQVPETMITGRNYDCLVRVAHSLPQLLEDLEATVAYTVEDIAVSEVMEIEIIDPSGQDNPAFQILLLSDGEQAVDEYSYTEWAFNVRPLRPGAHQLVLKVSILLTIQGKERTKNVVLRREIDVAAAESEAAVKPAIMRRMVRQLPPPAAEEVMNPKSGNYDYTEVIAPRIPRIDSPIIKEPATAGQGTPAPPPPVPAPTPARKHPARNWLSLAVTILLLLSAGWWISTDPFKDTDVKIDDRGSGDTSSIIFTDTLRRRDTLRIIE